MRNIIKNIQLSIDGSVMDFRLTKLDAFSGAALLQLLTKLPSAGETNIIQDAFVLLTPDELRSVMISCLNHVEVLLPAGYQPIMQGSAWSWPELEHDTATCLKLTTEEAIWTLQGFFEGGGSISRPAAPNSTQPPART